jgi:hypothetical protein
LAQVENTVDQLFLLYSLNIDAYIYRTLDWSFSQSTKACWPREIKQLINDRLAQERKELISKISLYSIKHSISTNLV